MLNLFVLFVLFVFLFIVNNLIINTKVITGMSSADIDLSGQKEFLKKFYTLFKENASRLWPLEYSDTPNIVLYSQINDYVLLYSELDISFESFEKNGDFFIKNWDNRFFGNSSTLLDGHYVAIVNMDSSKLEEDSLTPLMFHELFHAYQSKNWKKEVFGEKLYKYPINEECFLLRYNERRHLNLALSSSFEEEFIENIGKFLFFREKRSKIIPEFIDFEDQIECIEGTASYVDLTCEKELFLSEKNYKINLNRLSEIKNSYKNLRSSCYYSGAAICLILDKLVGGCWKVEFSKSHNLSLYKFLRSKVDIKEIPCKPFDEDKLIALINLERIRIKNLFENFYNKDGITIKIDGDMELRGYDPMNIEYENGNILHKNFYAVADSKTKSTIFINYPCIVNEVDYILGPITTIVPAESVTINESSIEIDGIGLLKYRFENNEEDKTITIYL